MTADNQGAYQTQPHEFTSGSTPAAHSAARAPRAHPDLSGPNPMKTHLIQFFSESPVTRRSPLAAADFYSLHERQSFFANSMKTKDRSIFYSLQNRPILKKRRTPDEGVRPDRVGTNALPDEGLHPPHGFGRRTASPSRAFIPLAPMHFIGGLFGMNRLAGQGASPGSVRTGTLI